MPGGNARDTSRRLDDRLSLKPDNPKVKLGPWDAAVRAGTVLRVFSERRTASCSAYAVVVFCGETLRWVVSLAWPVRVESFDH